VTTASWFIKCGMLRAVTCVSFSVKSFCLCFKDSLSTYLNDAFLYATCLLSHCLQLWPLLIPQVGARSLYLARRMKKIRGATLGHKPPVKITFQVVQRISSLRYFRVLRHRCIAVAFPSVCVCVCLSVCLSLTYTLVL